MIIYKYKSQPLKRCDIAQYALKIRNLLGYGPNDCVDVIKFLEIVLKIYFPNFPYIYFPKPQVSDNIHAYTNNDCIYIREDVYMRACDGYPRDRYTIAHEIGHFLLHCKGGITLTRCGGEKIPVYSDPEWQADVFAGELLCPSKFLANLSIEEIQKIYKVSSAAANTQKKHYLA